MLPSGNVGVETAGMKIKAIVFDKDGTVVDFEKLWIPVTRAAAYAAAKEYGLPSELTEEYLSKLGIVDENTVDIKGAVPRGAHTEIVGYFAEKLAKIGVFPNKDELAYEVLIKYDREAKRKYGRIEPTCENAKEVLSSLRARGITLALITADNKAGALLCLEELGIDGLFDHVIGFDGVSPTKPDPYSLNEFMREFSLSADEVVMVGDTETDILFAKNAGVYSLGVGRTEENRNLLRAAGADECFHDISYIPEWIDKASEI